MVKARDVFSAFQGHLARFDAGEIDLVAVNALMYRVTRELNRACWCDEGVCCQVHNEHVSPHQRCLLR